MEWKDATWLKTLWCNNRPHNKMFCCNLTGVCALPDVRFLSILYSVYTRIRLTTVTYLDTSVVLPADGEQVHVSSFRLAVSLQYIIRIRTAAAYTTSCNKTVFTETHNIRSENSAHLITANALEYSVISAYETVNREIKQKCLKYYFYFCCCHFKTI